MDVNQILYEDQDCIVCRKPAGVPTQSAKLAEQDLVSLAKGISAFPDSIPAKTPSKQWKECRCGEIGYNTKVCFQFRFFNIQYPFLYIQLFLFLINKTLKYLCVH